MAKFWMTPLVKMDDCITARLGTAAGDTHKDVDVNRFKKLVGESRYGDVAAGNDIEGLLVSVESATQDGFSIGTVQIKGRMEVTLNGLQATEGTGTIAVGDYVLAGTPVARGVAQTVPPKVVKATDQAAAKTSPFARRVVSIGKGAGTGAVGDIAVIERVTG